MNRKLIQMIVCADQRLLRLEGRCIAGSIDIGGAPRRSVFGAEMKTANSKLLTGRHALMLAVAMAPFAAADRAAADCTPASSASGATVTCSGFTNNSGEGGFTGYGTYNDSNNIYNIEADATVIGDNSVYGSVTKARSTFPVPWQAQPRQAEIQSVSSVLLHITARSWRYQWFHAALALGTTLQAGSISTSTTTEGTIVATTASVINRSTGRISGFLSAIKVDRTLDLDNAGTIEAGSVWALFRPTPSTSLTLAQFKRSPQAASRSRPDDRHREQFRDRFPRHRC